MAAVYRWLAYDLRTNAALAELPLGDVTYGATLNGGGTITATMPVTAATAAYLTAATIPERTIIYVERDGVLIDGFIVWARNRRPQQPIGLQGATLGSLLRRNRIITDITYTATDQHTIARGLVSAMQAQPGGDVGIAVGSTLSGVLRDRTYYAYERKNIGDALQQLAEVDNGFDWAIDIAWVAGVPTKSLTLSYPRRGRIGTSTGLVFESGKNLLGYDITEDGTRSARSVDAFGSGDGTDMKISTATRTDLIDAGYPLTAETISHKDVVVQATIDAHALAAVNARAATPTFLDVQVAPDDVDAGLGHWIVGDDVLVNITDDLFPVQADGTPGLRRYYRIIGYTVSVPSGGPETLSVTCGQVAA